MSVALPRQLLYVELCVLGYTTLLRKIRVVLGYIASLSLLCDLFKFDLLKLGRPLLMSFGSCSPSGRRDEFFVHESDDAITNTCFVRVLCALLLSVLGLWFVHTDVGVSR